MYTLGYFMFVVLTFNLGMTLHKKIIDCVSIVIGSDGILLTQQFLLGGNTTQHQNSLESIISSEQYISIQTITDHADTALVELELISEVINHEGTRLSDHSGFLPSASLNGANHGTVSSPFLCVSEMGHGIRVGGDEFAAWIFVDAKLGRLDLVIVDMTIESNDDGPYVLIVIELSSGSHIRHLVVIKGSSDPGHIDEIELFADSDFSNDVHLLSSLLKFSLLEVRRSSEGGGEDLLGRNIESKRVEFFLVPRTGFGGVVGDEEHLLSGCAELGESLGDSVNEGISAPDDAVAVEDEYVNSAEEAFLGVAESHYVGHLEGTAAGLEGPCLRADGRVGDEGGGGSRGEGRY
mmetsp:Transcript_7340/g.10706  ORF Transcript_7340/g.10706 Transcript_7340/m.10706 type:complete len:350 (-) Transcript_7340:183-1232(-)